jgi:hypothetical protein
MEVQMYSIAIPLAWYSARICLEEQEAALIDCANQAAVPLNPSQTVFRFLKGAVHLHFSTQVAVIEFDVAHAQPDWDPGEQGQLALVGLNHCYFILLASHARREPQG